MGLDQWFYKTKEPAKWDYIRYDDGTYSLEEYLIMPEDREEISYFRKNYSLNEWVCYNAVCDDIMDFNCHPVEITKDIVMSLFKDHIKGEVESEWKEHNERLFHCIKEVIEALSSGYNVYYYAWW
jgi:hypothetical protein